MEALLSAMLIAGLKAAVLVIVLLIGIKLGKFFRIKKDAKKNQEEA